MRLSSLDVFRGLTIALMILVNMAGVADHVYLPLDHAPWNGWTPTDLVFPWFLFAVGMSMAFSLSRYHPPGQRPPASLYAKIIKRAAILFALGLLLNGFYKYDLTSIRIMGVLQRISLCYLLSCLIVLNLSRKAQWALGSFLLVGYWLALTLVPVPECGAGVLTRECNFGGYVDRLFISASHLYKGDGWKGLGDPEGLFSTLPAVVSTLIGYWTGERLREKGTDSRISMDLVLAGLALVAAGKAWSWGFPINKKLWTSSYTLFMGGTALLALAACHELCDVRRWRARLAPFEQMGKNSLAAFVGLVFLIKLLVKFHAGSGEGAPTLFEWLNARCFEPWLGPYNGPTFFAVLTVLLWWLILRAMSRRGWHLRA